MKKNILLTILFVLTIIHLTFIMYNRVLILSKPDQFMSSPCWVINPTPEDKKNCLRYEKKVQAIEKAERISEKTNIPSKFLAGLCLILSIVITIIVPGTSNKVISIISICINALLLIM